MGGCRVERRKRSWSPEDTLRSGEGCGDRELSVVPGFWRGWLEGGLEEVEEELEKQAPQGSEVNQGSKERPGLAQAEPVVPLWEKGPWEAGGAELTAGHQRASLG